MERTDSINDFNDLNKQENLIVTTTKPEAQDQEQEKLVNNKESKEKILHLQKGSEVWKKVCIIFAVSFVVFCASFPLVFATRVYPLFAITGIASIGILYCLFFICCCCGGFITIAPNEAVVYQFYGRYLGTVKDNGYFFGYPFSKTFKINMKSKEYNGYRLKVNERDGNPVELGIVVIWRIGDTFKAIFDVENYQSFIEAQSEAAIRFIGCKYPYEPIVPGEISLRSGHEIINKELKQELERRISVSGIIIEDARVTEIQYGQEIAKMMLQKQASKSAVFAKEAIVKGATDAVMNSLTEFEKNGIEFNPEDKSSYVTDMMNTLCMGSGLSKIVSSS